MVAAKQARAFTESLSEAQKQALLTLAGSIAGDSSAQEIFSNTMLAIAVVHIKGGEAPGDIFENAHYVMSSGERYHELTTLAFAALEPLGVKKTDYRSKIGR
jgi:TPP-dependent trihydroxycyclohexane-1,2-dione (THcHDO) dehydratase